MYRQILEWNKNSENFKYRAKGSKKNLKIRLKLIYPCLELIEILKINSLLKINSHILLVLKNNVSYLIIPYSRSL